MVADVFRPETPGYEVELSGVEELAVLSVHRQCATNHDGLAEPGQDRGKGTVHESDWAVCGPWSSDAVAGQCRQLGQKPCVHPARGIHNSPMYVLWDRAPARGVGSS